MLAIPIGMDIKCYICMSFCYFMSTFLAKVVFICAIYKHLRKYLDKLA